MTKKTIKKSTNFFDKIKKKLGRERFDRAMEEGKKLALKSKKEGKK